MLRLDFKTDPQAVIDCIQEDLVPAIVSNLFEIDISSLQSLLKSGKEYKNGSWKSCSAKEIREVLSPTRNSIGIESDDLLLSDYGRLWRQFQGGITPMHFDGGPVAILNTQLLGRKKWLLISPQARVSFKSIGFGITHRHVKSIHLDSLDPEKIFFCTTTPGETIIIPTMWYHQVWTCEDSLNLDTYHPRSPSQDLSFRQFLGVFSFSLPNASPIKRLLSFRNSGLIDYKRMLALFPFVLFFRALHVSLRGLYMRFKRID